MQVSFKAIRPILALEPNNLTAMDTSELAGSEDYMNAYYAMAEKIIDKRG